jgi:hypothetical protein
MAMWYWAVTRMTSRPKDYRLHSALTLRDFIDDKFNMWPQLQHIKLVFQFGRGEPAIPLDVHEGLVDLRGFCCAHEQQTEMIDFAKQWDQVRFDTKARGLLISSLADGNLSIGSLVSGGLFIIKPSSDSGMVHLLGMLFAQVGDAIEKFTKENSLPQSSVARSKGEHYSVIEKEAVMSASLAKGIVHQSQNNKAPCLAATKRVTTWSLALLFQVYSSS